MLWVETLEASPPTTQHRLTSNTNRLAHSGENTTRSATNPGDRPHRLYLMWGCLGLDEAMTAPGPWRTRAGSDEARLCPTRRHRLSPLRPVPPCPIRCAPKDRGWGLASALHKQGAWVTDSRLTKAARCGLGSLEGVSPPASRRARLPGEAVLRDDACEEVDIEVRQVGRTTATEGEL